jgi:integrase
VTAALAAAAPAAAVSSVLAGVALEAPAARLASLLDAGFLAGVSWDPALRVLHMPADHPLLGWPACRVTGCVNRAGGAARICTSCRRRLPRHGLNDDEVHLLPAPARVVRLATCAVTGCPRVRISSRRPLCASHSWEQREIRKLPLAEFLAHPEVRPRDSFGRCAVLSCLRDRISSLCCYCDAHYKRLLALKKRGIIVDEQHWQRTESPIPEAGAVSLRGLEPLAVIQVLYGLQQRTRDGVKTRPEMIRLVIDDLRRAQVASIQQLPVPDDKGKRSVANSLARHVYRAFLDPEAEKAKDVWDLAAFGFGGHLSFTKISQRWLREAIKQWALDDLPKRRGDSARGFVQHHVNCAVMLSGSLRAIRDDRGEVPALLGRADIESFLHRLAYQEASGKLTHKARSRIVRQLKRMLARVRSLGLTRPGGPAAGLADDFVLLIADVPQEPEEEEHGRDLPPEIMRQLCEHLPSLEELAKTSREVRVAVELAIDTGRRPDDICDLPWDCLARDDNGDPVLVYDNHKRNRPGRRLPLPEATARLITEQKQRVRQRFPGTPIAELKLLPSHRKNPDGARPIGDASMSERHRIWVNSLPPLVLADGTEFDKAQVVPYAYRHTYAQRHADAGVPVDVLRELMDHRLLDTTKRYYRIGEARRRQAVDRVASLQFDRHGNRIWRTAKALLDAEHARRAVGEVVVPFGVCGEPSNVKAGGHACPFRFRCAGCDHFRTDVSYLPDLQAYLDDLLRNRERLLAATERRGVGPRRGDALGGGDPPHPAAHQPDQDRPGRAVSRGPGPGRPGRRRRPAAPHRDARHAPHPPAPARRPPGAFRMTPSREPARTAPLAEGRQADSARRRQRVLKALNQAAASGGELSVSAIARAAQVDRTFLYRHRDLLEQLHTLAAQPPGSAGTGPAVTRASLQADLANAQARSSRLASRVQQLEKRLSETLGEQAWRQSGLGAPDDIEQLKARITTLEQQLTDLRLREEELTEELHAARAANRELMTRLNAPSPRP